MSATSQRDHAIRIAPSDPERALSRAEDIDDPWFSIEVLAAVLRYGPAHRNIFVCRRALVRVSGCFDAYRRGVALARLIRALAARGPTSLAATVLGEAVRQALRGTVSPASGSLSNGSARRGAAVGTPQESSPHWHASRALVHALAMHSVVAPDSCFSILSPVRDPRIPPRVHRCTALELTRPREFFWER